MSQTDVLERMAMASGLDASESRHAREWLATTREGLGDPVATPPFLHPPRWVVAGTPGDEPPAGRIGFLFGGIEEVWRPEYAFDRMGRSSLKGYWVTQRWMSSHCDCVERKGLLHIDGQFVHPKCGRALENKHKTNAEYVDNIKDIQISAMQDDDYSGFYGSLKGDDVIRLPDKPEKFMRVIGPHEGKIAVSGDHYDVNGRLIQKGQVMRGGKEITGGRRQYREHLKATRFEPVDSGYAAHVERNAKARKAKQKRDIEHAAEKIAHKYFPMSGRTGEC